MCCKVVIPSHKRADRVKSKVLVPNPILCVAESQEDEYKFYNPECEIVTHPDSVVGLIPKRNWIVQHFGDVFMIDDDVVAVQRLYKPKGESNEVLKDPEQVQGIIDRLYSIAKMTGVSLFGFNKDQRPVFYDPAKPFVMDKNVTGCAYGVIKGPNIWWNEELQLKEDFWISCWIKFKERLILVDERYHFNQVDTFVNAGGLSEIRNDRTEMQNMLKLKKYFGDAIQMKGKGSVVKSFKKYNISVNFPF